MSDSFQPHGLQHYRLLCPSLSPRVCSNLCPLSQWCYLTISSSATFFSFCFQSFPASRSFPLSRLFVSGGQSIGASTSAWVLSVNIQAWFPLGLTGLISLLSKGLWRVFSSTTVRSINSLAFNFLHCPTLMSVHNFWDNHSFDHRDICRQSDVAFFFNMLSRFVIAFLPRSNVLSTVILELKKIKSVTSSFNCIYRLPRWC